MKALDEQLRVLGKGLWWHPKRREIMQRFHDLVARVDWQRLEAAQREYGDRMRKASADSRYKYFDVAFYTLQKLLLAYELGLDRGPPRRILDIGTGENIFLSLVSSWTIASLASTSKIQCTIGLPNASVSSATSYLFSQSGDCPLSSIGST
jgi:hypothetical protein